MSHSTDPLNDPIPPPLYSFSDAQEIVRRYRTHDCKSQSPLGCLTEVQVRAFLAAKWPERADIGAEFYSGMFNAIMLSKAILDENSQHNPSLRAVSEAYSMHLGCLMIAVGIKWIDRVGEGENSTPTDILSDSPFSSLTEINLEE